MAVHLTVRRDKADLLGEACQVEDIEGRLELVKKLVEHYHCDLNGETVCGGVH